MSSAAKDLARCAGPDDPAAAPYLGGATVDLGTRVVAFPKTPWRDAPLVPAPKRSGPPGTVVKYRGHGVTVRWPPLPGQRDVRLDPATGALDLLRRSVSPATTRLTADVLDGTWRDMRTGWAWLDLVHEDLDGGRWTVSLGFERARLAMLLLAHWLPGESGGWDSWSREREQAAQDRHDAWLRAQVGERRDFAWGSAWSSYDDRAAAATLALDYEVRA
jgi:hypothetical protein